MSGGPIKAERDAWKPRTVSTSSKDRVCKRAEGRGYCGRSSAPLVDDWSDVTCTDCHAAHRADEAVTA